MPRYKTAFNFTTIGEDTGTLVGAQLGGDCNVDTEEAIDVSDEGVLAGLTDLVNLHLIAMGQPVITDLTKILYVERTA
jgi:hypothetical protein